MSELRLSLEYRLPYDWEAILLFMASHAIAGLEVVEGQTYARTVSIGKSAGWIRVRPDVPGRLTLEISSSLRPQQRQLVPLLRSFLDLDADPQAIAQRLGQDPRLSSLLEARPGLRVPGALDGFELAWRAILGQQISVIGARTLGSRLVKALGQPLLTEVEGLDRLAPTAQAFLDAGPDVLGPLGWIRSRSGAVAALAVAMRDQGLRLEPDSDPQATIAALMAIKGIGRWTAGYIALRALRWNDAWPHGDVVLKKAMAGGDATPDPGWSPYLAYAAMHLWYSQGTLRP